MQLLQRLIERSMLARRHTVQASPIQTVVLRDCRAQGALPAQMLQQLLLRCPSVREVDVRGFGACHYMVNQRGYMHFNDLLALLRTFNMNKHLMQQVRGHASASSWAFDLQASAGCMRCMSGSSCMCAGVLHCACCRMTAACEQATCCLHSHLACMKPLGP